MEFSLAPRPFIVLAAIAMLLFSLIGFLYPWVNTTIFICLIVIIAVGTAIKFEFGVHVALFELILGGYGYLFSIPIFGYSISLRIGIFIVLAFFFVLKLLREKKFPKILATKLRLPFFTVIAFVLLAAIVGLIRNDLKLAFFDANAYVALLYIPFFMEAIFRRIHVRRLIFIFSSAVTALGIVTIGFLALYATFHYSPSLSAAISLNEQQRIALENTRTSDGAIIGQRVSFDQGNAKLDYAHVTQTKPETYRWLRDTGTAQISYITGHFFRIFFPSQLYVLLMLCMVGVKFFFHKKSFNLFFSAIFLSVVLIISYSRSLWLGTTASALLLYSWILVLSKRKFIIIFTTILLLSSLTVFGSATTSFSVVSDRITSIINPTTDVAGAHRIELGKEIIQHIKAYPIFGTGFGTLVTFPTILPSGEIIATSFYIFEWAYGDIAVKMGIGGLIAFLGLLFAISKKGMSKNVLQTRPILFGTSLACVGLAVANITTPIYTHPLGFGALAFMSALLYASYENTNSDRHVE